MYLKKGDMIMKKFIAIKGKLFPILFLLFCLSLFSVVNIYTAYASSQQICYKFIHIYTDIGLPWIIRTPGNQTWGDYITNVIDYDYFQLYDYDYDYDTGCAY